MASKPKPQDDIHWPTVMAIIATTFAVAGIIFLVTYLVSGKSYTEYWSCADGYAAKYTCEARLTERPLAARVETLEAQQESNKARLEDLEKDDHIVRGKLKLPTPTPAETSTVWATVCAPNGNCYLTGVR